MGGGSEKKKGRRSDVDEREWESIVGEVMILVVWLIYRVLLELFTGQGWF